MSRSDIIRLLSQKHRRLWVEISKEETGQPRRPKGPGFWAHKDGWWITGEFVQMDRPEYQFKPELGVFVSTGAENILVVQVEGEVDEEDRPKIRHRIGIGAGSIPTALSMVRDGDLLLAQ